MNWFIDNKLNELFIAVEWAEKGDLKLVMKRNIEEDISFPEKRIWEYISQIAGALEIYAWEEIYAHGFKAFQNFIDSNNDLKVGDLGLSRQLSS